MPKDRYFLDQDLKKNAFIKLKDKEAHHLKTSMRKKLNDVVEIINARGFLAKARIKKIEPKVVTLFIEDVFISKENKKRLVLALAIIKPCKMDLILEKCTELGCTDFWFFHSLNSEKIKMSKNRLLRMNHILIAALKQSGVLFLPKIKIFNSLKYIKNLDGQKYFGSLKDKSKHFLDIHKKIDKNIYFFIGPEKGFANEEISYLEKDLKVIGVKLNKNILRAETAAIASIVITAPFLQS